MTNPFEDPDGTYFVLVNREGQYSLWPDFVDGPPGWTVVHERDSRSACITYIDTHWTDEAIGVDPLRRSPQARL